MSYDSWLVNSGNIFRVDTAEMYPGRAPLLIARAPGPMRQALLADFAQIEDIARAHLTSISVVENGRAFNERVLVADRNFFELIALPFIEGEAQGALANTTSVALSRRMAEKLFGTSGAVGKSLTLLAPEAKDFKVAAVFETLPSNSHMAFDIVIPIDSFFARRQDSATPSIPDQWGGAYFYTYLRLIDGTDATALQAALPAFVDKHLPTRIVEAIAGAPHDFYKFNLVPLRDIHFDGAPLAAMKPKGDIATVMAFAGIALLILAIGCINFTNLATARSMLRAREVALRKVVGAGRGQLIVQFLGEAFILTAIALILALGLVELALPHYNAFINKIIALDIGADPTILLGLLGLTVLVGLAAGLHPAFVMSAIRPATMLKSGPTSTAGHGRLRALLVLLQFAISIALITATLVIFQQTQFARNADLGFKTDEILIVHGPRGTGRDVVVGTLMDRLRAHPEVIAVAASSAVPSVLSEGSEANAPVFTLGGTKPILLGIQTVGTTFFQTYAVEPIAGRLFSEQISSDAMTPLFDGTQDERGSAIINQSAVIRLGFAGADDAIGQVMRAGSVSLSIVGVVPDLHFRSLRQNVRPEFYVTSATPGSAISIRFRTDDVAKLLSFVDRVWTELVPDRAIRRTFLDDSLDALYAGDRERAVLLGAFAALAVIVSCLGLFAMASISAQRRTLEIGIRKVMGAGTVDITRLLIWQFCRPVLIANLVAGPVAWWFLRDWLNGFAYRTELTPLPFVAAGAIALLIASATVANHALHVARSKPVKALRHE